MNDGQKLNAIRLLYEGYFNTDQDVEEFAAEFFHAIGDILSGIELKYLDLKFLNLDEILTPGGKRYVVDFWFERDRLGVWVTDNRMDKVVFEVWDDDARQLFEDGFFESGPGFKASVLLYLEETGVI